MGPCSRNGASLAETIVNLLGIGLAAVAAGAGVTAWAAVAPAAQLFGRTLRRTGHASAIALTFDDGPNPAVTPGLLDLLSQHNVRATFFLIGQHVRACPELAREIVARGHTLGNHTDTHPSLFWLSPSRIGAELDRCQESLEWATGRRAAWMRPPYGIRGPQLEAVVRRLGFGPVVMWRVIAFDWEPQPVARVIERLCPVRGGDIVCLHDGGPHALGADRRHTLAALEFWLPRWTDAGFEFVTLDEISSGEDRSAPRIPGEGS